MMRVDALHFIKAEGMTHALKDLHCGSLSGRSAVVTTMKNAIETYIHAKDGNRPHLMASAFAEDAELIMDLRTAEIAFPTAVSGERAISKVLVSEFSRQYENVYTFCIDMPARDEAGYQCDWLVCMTEKVTGLTRVGYGQYDWHRQSIADKISTLRITIQSMTTLPQETSGRVLDWAGSLPYPWCPREALTKGAPAIAAVDAIIASLQQRGG